MSTHRYHCGDHNCLVGGPARGMATNSGCHCLLDLKPIAKRRAVQQMLNEHRTLTADRGRLHAEAEALRGIVRECADWISDNGEHDRPCPLHEIAALSVCGDPTLLAACECGAAALIAKARTACGERSL